MKYISVRQGQIKLTPEQEQELVTGMEMWDMIETDFNGKPIPYYDSTQAFDKARRLWQRKVINKIKGF